MSPRLDRRDFLRESVALGATLGAGPGLAQAQDEPARVRRYVELGRTGLAISDVSFGSSRLAGDESLVRFALDRGINYFDTAESYRGGASEETIGRALEGRREQVVLASKVKCEASSSRHVLMKALEDSLRRLRTDRIEVYFNHAVNDVARLRNDEWAEFTTRARAAGKIRFTGMSGHGGRLVECLDYALDRDLVDVILVGYNFGQDPAFYEKFLGRFDFVALQPELPRALAKAKAAGVGTIAMKTLMGGRLNDLRPFERGGASFAQAAFRWVLSDPHVDALVVSMTGREQVEEYLGASGFTRKAFRDPRLLERYLARNGETYCRPGCGACLSSCPHGVEIDEVLRTRMYLEDYADPELARSDYAKLGRDAASCLGCPAPCAASCPYGLAIPVLTAGTHLKLSTGRG